MIFQCCNIAQFLFLLPSKLLLFAVISLDFTVCTSRATTGSLPACTSPSAVDLSTYFSRLRLAIESNDHATVLQLQRQATVLAKQL